MNRTAMVAAVVVAFTAAAGGAWWVLGDRGAHETARIALPPGDARLIARGADVYAAQCASCHGAKLEGQPNWRERGPDGLLPAPPHDASGHTWHHPDALLIRITRDGVGAVVGDPSYRTAMPAYREVLGDEDIVAVLSWIKSRWPAEVRAKHDQINAQSR